MKLVPQLPLQERRPNPSAVPYKRRKNVPKPAPSDTGSDTFFYIPDCRLSALHLDLFFYMINKPKGSPGKLLMPLPHQHRSGFQLRFSTIATALVIRLYAAAVSMVEKASPNQLISSFLTVSLRAMIRGVPLKSSGCTQDFPAKAESFLTSTPHCSLTGIRINLYLLISAAPLFSLLFTVTPFLILSI